MIEIIELNAVLKDTNYFNLTVFKNKTKSVQFFLPYIKYCLSMIAVYKRDVLAILHDSCAPISVDKWLLISSLALVHSTHCIMLSFQRDLIPFHNIEEITKIA